MTTRFSIKKEAQDNLMVSKSSTSYALPNKAAPKTESKSNFVVKAQPKSVPNRDTLSITNVTCTTVDNVENVSICSDKCVNVIINKNITKQKYIKNVDGPEVLCTGTIDSSNVYSNVVTNVCRLAFDDDSGFSVVDMGNGLSKVQISSLTSPATPTTLGTTYAYNQTAYCNTYVGYCAGNIASTGSNNIAIGQNALVNNTTGTNNVAIGPNALKSQISNNTGYGNIAIGKDSLSSFVTGFGNIAIGECSMYCFTSPYGTNIAIGHRALKNRIEGGGNVAIGFEAMSDSVGSPSSGSNVALGSYALRSHKWGHKNIAIGDSSMYGMITGYENVVIGAQALVGYTPWCGDNNVVLGSYGLRNALVANRNIAIGHKAGLCVTTGENNTIIGSLNGTSSLFCTVLIGAGSCERIKVDDNGLCINGSLISNAGPATPTTLGTTYAYNQTSYYSTYVGYCAGNTASTGFNNIAVGKNSLLNNTTGNNNVAIGTNALSSQTGNSYGYGNVAIGKDAMFKNVSGYGNVAIGDCALYCSNGLYVWGNVGIGYAALKNNITGGTNVAIGYGSLERGTGGSSNTAVGTRTFRCLTAGNGNVALGHDAGFYLSEGCYNIAVGRSALKDSISGNNNNIGIGFYTLRQLQNATDNIALGFQAGFNNTSGSHNLSIGCFSLLSNTTGSCNVAIGVKSLYGNVGSNNISIGPYSGCDITTGINNTIIGSLCGSSGLVCTVLVGAGTCERIKVDNSGLSINGLPFPNSLYDSFTNITGATGVVTHNFALGPIFRHTSVASNFTVNVTNLNLDSGRVTNISIIVIQGATPYVPNAFQIGGVAQTINWNDTLTPTGTSNKVDIFNFSILNNSGTYLVLGQDAAFG